ncbi:hypothetical protein AVEN_267599-1 [Araneus ventricosus]|uniref:Uncharacterized protein n=1 Tax=Araneus ventricosus TaxID=182803 RepID=A0A4Y2HG95_ARAVE|nr:hypothetical protein AVEN_267599-1 [Araneus ventricosus]
MRGIRLLINLYISDTYNVRSVVAELLDIAVFFLIFSAFLFEIVIVCSLSGNRTFGHPEAELGDNSTGYQKTGHLGIPKLRSLGTTGQATKKRDIWASRS